MPRRISLLALLLALALLALPAQAFGAANHPFLRAIKGSPAGFEDACGVASYGGGLYVSDYYHDSIVGPTTIAKEDPGAGPCKLAFDTPGNLYVNNWHHNVLKYTEPFTTGAATVVDSAEPTGLAVDQVTGNVYVAHHTYVAAYDSTGAPIATIGAGNLEEAFGVAISDFPATAGNIYVPDAASHTVKVFNSAGALIEEMDGSATPQGGFSYLVDSEVAVDNSPTSPSYGHVFVLDAIGHGLSEHPEGAIDEFNAQGNYRGQINGFTDAEPSGIAIDAASGNLYVTSGNSEDSAVFLYGPTAPARTLKVTKTGAGGGGLTSSPKGINCGAACSAEFNEGQTVTLFANPDGHSVFSGWSVAGEPSACPGTGTCSVLLSANREVTANFEEPVQETLTVSKTGSGEGTVTSAPGAISCPGSCSEHFNQGRIVTLTAHPDPHNKLMGWSGCTVQTNPAECKLTLTAAVAVSAEFAAIPQKTLSVVKTGSGQGTVSSTPSVISCPGTCSGPFDEGSTVYLTAAPAPTSVFLGFSGGGCSGTAPICAVTMTEAMVVGAEFLFVSSTPTTSAISSGLSAGHLSVGKVDVKGSYAIVELAVPSAGTVLATGEGLKAMDTMVEGGRVTLPLSLSKAAKRVLGSAKSQNLRIKTTISFSPSDGGPDDSANRVICFKVRNRSGSKALRHFRAITARR